VQQKPGAVSRPGNSRNFGEYSFLEDSRYMSQEDSVGDFISRKTFDRSGAYSLFTPAKALGSHPFRTDSI
jgi:hypothetical protein